MCANIRRLDKLTHSMLSFFIFRTVLPQFIFPVCFVCSVLYLFLFVVFLQFVWIWFDNASYSFSHQMYPKHCPCSFSLNLLCCVVLVFMTSRYEAKHEVDFALMSKQLLERQQSFFSFALFKTHIHILSFITSYPHPHRPHWPNKLNLSQRLHSLPVSWDE